MMTFTAFEHPLGKTHEGRFRYIEARSLIEAQEIALEWLPDAFGNPRICLSIRRDVASPAICFWCSMLGEWIAWQDDEI